VKFKNLIIWTLIAVMGVLFLSACESQGTQQSNTNMRTEQLQQSNGIAAILANQPVPDLGGYSFEREILRKTYVARNSTISTFTYDITMEGKVIEICPSIGYPIPYSTELTNPDQIMTQYTGNPVIANPEPNGLYPPASSAATLVQCVQPDGTVSPVYYEREVQAFPYRIKSDIQLTQIGDASFTVKMK
jgi:hypothetical protein